MTIILSMLSWAGAITGTLGAALLAAKVSYSRYGFVLYLASNVCWIIYATATRSYALLFMQCVFTVISTIGIVRWFGLITVRSSAPPARKEPLISEPTPLHAFNIH